jgi:hypothetical protein
LRRHLIPFQTGGAHQERQIMNTTEPVARIVDMQVISYNGGGSPYSGMSSSFNKPEVVRISQVDFDFLSLEALVFRPTSVVGTYVRMKARRGMPLFLGDIVYNGTYVISCLEFFIGGRVSLNSSASCVIDTERSVVQHHKSAARTALERARSWSPQKHQYKQPLEIQTNGGTMGIKG